MKTKGVETIYFFIKNIKNKTNLCGVDGGGTTYPH
jgi:hypothetical protein